MGVMLLTGKPMEETDIRQIVVWESMNLDEYLRRTEAEEQEKIENQVKVTNTRSAQCHSYCLMCSV